MRTCAQATSALRTLLPAAGVWLCLQGVASATTLVVVGGNDGWSEKVDQAEWNQLHPDIELSLSTADFSKVAAMIAAGDPPDLIRIMAKDVPGFVHAGLLADITPYVEKSGLLPHDDMIWPVLDEYRIDGKLYALNKDWSADMTLYYNKNLFDEAGLSYPDAKEPLTFAELQTISRKLTKMQDGKYVQWGFGGGYQPTSYQMMLRSAEQPFYAPDGQSLDLEHNSQAVAAATWWADMATRHWYAYGVPDDPWHGGKVGIWQMGYWFGPVAAIGGHQNVYSNDASTTGTTEPIGFAPAPMWGGQRADTALATGFAILAASKHKDEAFEALAWFMDGPASQRRSQTGFGMPSRKSYFRFLPQATPLDRQRYEVTLAETPYLVPQYPNSYDQAAFADAWSKEFGALADGSISPQEFLHRVDHDVTTALQKAAQS